MVNTMAMKPRQMSTATEDSDGHLHWHTQEDVENDCKPVRES